MYVNEDEHLASGFAMAHIIELLEQTAFATWVRESTSIFAYTTVLSLHAMGLAVVVGVNAMIAMRILGVARGIPLAPTLRYFPLMHAGFWVNAISGVILLMAHASSMLSNTMFFIKLGFIGLAVISIAMIRSTVFNDAHMMAGGAITSKARALAAASLFFWAAAIVAGRLTAYPFFVESWFGI